MIEEVKIQKFERLSFWELLKTRSIEIPIIQRDYAQGRVNKEKVRNDFLERLKSALIDYPVELDFVYGSEENNFFQPLDGQQRLTTLFLLHWFIANKEGGVLEEVKNRLAKFTYETRSSSREFCKELIYRNIDYQNLLPINADNNITEENQLSETIKNASWFVISWEKDPTISTMLVMIDAINAKFKFMPNLWGKLGKTVDEKCPITFLYVKLENFGLSDDLYIKMNARGKQLTPFENFKSRFENHIELSGWENDLLVKESDTVEENKEKLSKQFKYKIDTIWTDLFWKYKRRIEKIDENGNIIIEYEIDSKLINFIAGVAINCYAINYVTPDKEKIEQRIKILSDSPNEISKEDFSTEFSYKHLVACLNKYAEKVNNNFSNAELKTDIDLWNNGFGIDTSLFKGLIAGENVTMQKRVLFYAQTMFLLNKSFEYCEFKDWMRVIRNVVENATGNWNLERMISAIKFVANLMDEYKNHSNDIYSLLNLTTKSFSFNTEQIKEEIEKAKIIIANPFAKQIIHDTEDTNFCKGKIDFPLYCSDYNIETPNPNTFDKGKLEKMCKVINDHLLKDDVTNDFRRAFFTIQNNDFYTYKSSGMWYGKFDRYCLLENTNDFKNHFALRGKNNNNINNNNWLYSKELLNKLSHSSIDDIISKFQNDSNFNNISKWIQTIINKSKFLDKCEKHYVCHYKQNGKWYIVKWNTAVKEDNWDGLMEIKLL